MIDRPDLLTLEEILRLSDDEKAAFGLKYTPSEIAQQPETWGETVEIVSSYRSRVENFLAECRPTNVLLIGAGTSDYIGRAVAPALRQEWKTNVAAIPSTDLLTEMDKFVEAGSTDHRDLWISFSRSGDSFEGVKILERAFERYADIHHLIITCSKDGRMAEMSKGRENVLCLVLDDKVNDRGLAMTSSFTNMVVAGLSLAQIHRLDDLGSTISQISKIARLQLNKISEIARSVAQEKHDRICFLGSGALKAVADESALKVLELSGGYHSTMAESFLGLRHGPLSWLNKSALVVGFVSNDPETAKVELGLLSEVRGKKAAGSILAIAPADCAAEAIADLSVSLSIPKGLADDLLTPIYVLCAQTLGLYSSLACGLLPDTPSADGKIQRVVSDITFA
ncbi:MAG: SIS domain-containing protein [Acidobacteria bacterium]|nr:SIS domain-containing protein [Acidobacteriota bacterium]